MYQLFVGPSREMKIETQGHHAAARRGVGRGHTALPVRMFSAARCTELIEAAKNGCEDTIRTAAAYAALHREHAGLVLHMWEKGIDVEVSSKTASSPARALALLYFANELLQAYRADATWHRVFSGKMPSVFPRVYACCQAAQDAQSAARVLGLARKVWRDREVFSACFLEGLLERCLVGEPSARRPCSPPPPEYEPECSPSPGPAGTEEGLGKWLGVFSTVELPGMMALSPGQLAAGSPPPFLAAGKAPAAENLCSSLSAAILEASIASDAEFVPWLLVRGELLSAALEAKTRCEKGLAAATAAMEARISSACQHRLVLAIQGAKDLESVARSNEEDERVCAAAVPQLQAACRDRWTKDMALWRSAMDAVLPLGAAGKCGAKGHYVAVQPGDSMRVSLVCLQRLLREFVTCPALQSAQEEIPLQHSDQSISSIPIQHYDHSGRSATNATAIGQTLSPFRVERGSAGDRGCTRGGSGRSTSTGYSDQELLEMFATALLQHQQSSSLAHAWICEPHRQEQSHQLQPHPWSHSRRASRSRPDMVYKGAHRGRGISPQSERGAEILSRDFPHAAAGVHGQRSTAGEKGGPSGGIAQKCADTDTESVARQASAEDCTILGTSSSRVTERNEAATSRAADSRSKAWEQSFPGRGGRETAHAAGVNGEKNCNDDVEVEEDLIVERQQLSLLCPLSCKRFAPSLRLLVGVWGLHDAGTFEGRRHKYRFLHLPDTRYNIQDQYTSQGAGLHAHAG